MQDVSQLVQTGLSVLLVPILLLSRFIRLKFAADPNKPTLHESVIYSIMAALSLGLAFAQHSLQQLPPQSVVDFWWVQGILFFAALCGADMGVDATSTKTVGSAIKIAEANAVATEAGGEKP